MRVLRVVTRPNLGGPMRQAIEQHASRILLLDDGFQHRRLGRDLDIVLLDALQPYGFSHVFPRGTLREPLSNLARAGVVVLTRSDLVDATERERIRDRVRKQAPSVVWVETCHRPLGLLAADGTRTSLDPLLQAPLAAFCGVGNPDGFRRTLDRCGLAVKLFRAYPDHHAYPPQDVQQLTDWVTSDSGVSAAICTHKDLVKIDRPHLGNVPLWALLIGVQVTRGQEQLERRLEKLLALADE